VIIAMDLAVRGNAASPVKPLVDRGHHSLPSFPSYPPYTSSKYPIPFLPVTTYHVFVSSLRIAQARKSISKLSTIY